MFKDLISPAGEFRKSGVYSENKFEDIIHNFPHHKIITNSINNLCSFTYRIASYIDSLEYKNEWEHLCNVIGLASFVQFHFVDIHPFVDGNGRMCRFLSKYILDSILPIPIPMFKDRDQYLNSIINGRKNNNILELPVLLATLIFNETIKYYKEIIKNNKNKSLCYFIPAVNNDELVKELHERKYNEKEISKISENFLKLKLGESQIIDISNDIYDKLKILKQEIINWKEIDLDDL